MQKRLKHKHQRRAPQSAWGRGGQAVLPRLSLEGGTAVLPGPASAARTHEPTDGGTSPRRPPPLPPSSARASSLGGGGGDRPGGPATPPDPAASPGAPHRRSVGRHIAVGTRRPRWFVPLRPMAPARAQFENGAERRSRSTRRERRGCPGNRPERPTVAGRAPGGDGGFRPRCPET